MENNVVLPEQSPYMMDAKQLARYKATRLGEGLAENEKELVVCSPAFAWVLSMASGRAIKLSIWVLLVYFLRSVDMPLISRVAAFALPWVVVLGIIDALIMFWCDVRYRRKTFFIVTSQRILVQKNGELQPDIWMKDIREVKLGVVVPLGHYVSIPIRTTTDGRTDSAKQETAQIFNIKLEIARQIMNIIEEKRKEQMMK